MTGSKATAAIYITKDSTCRLICLTQLIILKAEHNHRLRSLAVPGCITRAFLATRFISF